MAKPGRPRGTGGPTHRLRNPANVAAQTVTFELRMNGIPIPGSTSAAEPTNNPGELVVLFSFPPAIYVTGTKIAATLKIDVAPLMAPLTDIIIGAA